jgi:hypothetical protein
VTGWWFGGGPARKRWRGHGHDDGRTGGVQGPWPRPGSKEEGVLCCTVLVGNCTDYGLVLLLDGYGTESCFGPGGGGHWLLLQAFPDPDRF